MMHRDLEHPEVTMALRTGYPSWMQENDQYCEDDDALYEESREREIFGD